MLLLKLCHDKFQEYTINNACSPWEIKVAIIGMIVGCFKKKACLFNRQAFVYIYAVYLCNDALTQTIPKTVETGSRRLATCQSCSKIIKK